MMTLVYMLSVRITWIVVLVVVQRGTCRHCFAALSYLQIETRGSKPPVDAVGDSMQVGAPMIGLSSFLPSY